jgi:hypothetical protein
LSRPAILLPCCLVEKLSAEELDQVGLHEMAHLARWDDWTNLVQKLIEAVFFFHPAVHWIGRQLNLEREIACDDWVIFRTGKPKPYAACLTRLVELTGRMDVPALAPGSWTTKKQISRRIEMSLNRSRNDTPRLSKASLFVSVLVLLFVGIQFARTSPLVRAAEQEEKKQEKVSPTKEKAQLEEEEALPEETEEPEPIPVERPLTPERRLALEMAEEKEKQQQQQYQELQERQRQEREVLMVEAAERRARALRALKERQIVQEHRRAEELKELQFAQQNRLAEAEALLQELNQESFERGVVQYASPTPYVRLDEEPAIPEDELIALMSEIVRNDSDSKVRAAALESIGRLGSEAASEALADLYDSIPELELKKKALSSMSFSRKFTPKARAKLIDIAKTSPQENLRKAALRALAGVPEDDGASALISIYDSADQTETKKTVIRYLSLNRSEAAIDKLKAIARKESDAGLRLEAVQSLGRLHGGLRYAVGVPFPEPMLAVPVPEKPPVPPKPPKKK